MNKKSFNFYFWAMGALGEGLSGGDRIFIELARRWAKLAPITLYLWEEGKQMCQRQNLQESENLKLKVLKMKFWCRGGFLICYLARILRSVFEAWRVKLEEGTIIYSASEFWMDSLPALILKLRYPQSTWVAAWYQTAPNPLIGFSEGERKNRYRVGAFFYWLLQYFIKPLISRFADIVLVNNDEERKQFPELIQENRVRVVLGAVDLEKIKKWKRDREYLPKIYDAVFQGRFHPQKGIFELVDIWKLIVNQKSKAKLAVIGNGPLMQDVKAKVKKLGLEENIKFFGYVYDGPEKYTIFSQSRIVVHPAFYDSGGMAAAEAMAFGLPCVGFKLKSYESYYPRGIVKVKTGNLQTFSEEIIKLIDNSAYREKVGQDAFKMINENWSWDIRAKEVLDFLISFPSRR